MFGRLSNVARGALVGAFVMPHGCMILDADPNKDPESHKLHIGMKKCAAEIKSLKPDIILLTTPHGVSLTNSLAVYENKYASGSAEWKGQWTGYVLNIELDSSKANNLIKWINNKCQNNKYNVDGFRYIYNHFETPIRWGEVVPLWYVKDILVKHYEDQDEQQTDERKVENDNNGETKVIIMSSRLANTRYDMDPTDINDLNALRYVGENILDWCDNIDERIVVITSGDLSHRHKNDIDQRYTAHENAQPFDDYIDLWCKTMDSEYLNKAGMLQFTASSCGITGFAILDGILQKWKRIYALRSIKNDVVVPATHPTYFGMTCVSFLFDQNGY